MDVTGPTASPIRLPLPVPAERRAGQAADRARAEAARPAPAGPAAGDSSLWSILTPEEREFFARQANLTPATYQPSGAPRPDVPVPTGRRIDVRA